MGRALLIICAGLLVSLGYTFFGISSQSRTLTQRNIITYNDTKAKNTANTGIQLAIQRYNNDSNKEEFTNVSDSYDGAALTLSLDEMPDTDPDKIRITSSSVFNGADHTVIITFDISQNQSLVPEFNNALGIATDNFTFGINGNAAQINGNDLTGDPRCSNKPGVSVTSSFAKDNVGEYDAIDGVPDNEAAIDENMEFETAEDLITSLENQPGANYLSGSEEVTQMGTASDPGVFFIEENIKLGGGIEEGFGILVIRSNADFDYEGGLEVRGNFTFNGLVIFQNASEFDAAGTPNINGSVLVGNSDNFNPTNISIKGNVSVQYDCTAKDYADLAVNNILNTTIYKPLSVYE